MTTPTAFAGLLLITAATASSAPAKQPAVFPPPETAPDCAGKARGFAGDLSLAYFRKEPESVVRAIYREATQVWPTCSNNEAIAYFRLRAAELRVDYGPHPDFDWPGLAIEIGSHFPRSARITTVAARASGSMEAARAAVALDPHYTPALVVLAKAQVRAGDPVSAVATLKPAGNLAAVRDGFTVLARARFDSGETVDAIRAANDALHPRASELVEPDAGDLRPRFEAKAILGLAYLKQGKRRAAARELKAAAEMSETAREAIAHADPALQRELKRLRSPRQ